MGNFIDITGQRFGKLTVINKEKNDKRGEARWLCQCDCGKSTIALSSHIRNYRIRSCGCLSRKNKFLYESKYGNSTDYERLYHIFNGMRTRCYNPKDINYKNYGGRGIKICDEWLEDFFKFMDWSMQNKYQNNLTIDRIDVNGNYEPNNCRWINIKEQENNRRDNVFLKHKGKIKTLKQWAETINIPYNTLYSRYYREIELLKNHTIKQINVNKILYKNDLRRRKNEKGNK